MARIALGGLTTLNLATHLDPQFVDLYNLRELISSPGYEAATPKLSIDSNGNFQVGAISASIQGPLHVSKLMSSNNASDARIVITRGIPQYGSSLFHTYSTNAHLSGDSFGLIVTDNADPTDPTRAKHMVGANGAHVWYGATTSTIRLVLDTSGHFSAGVDNSSSCGIAARRWSVIYAGTGTINTSDAREKTVVASLTANEIAAAKALASEIGTYQFLGAIAGKGAAGARQHVGMTVQRAIELMQSHGLDPMRYGFICYDAWPERTDPAQFREEREDTGLVDSNNEPIYNITQVEVQPERVIPAGDRYSFRPDELLLFIARGFEARLAALEAAAAA